MKQLIVALVLIAFVLLEQTLADNMKPPNTYCTKRQVREIMKTACPSNPSTQKRSFYHTKSGVFNKQDQYILWRRIFNIQGNATVTIPEASFQLHLLFGRCNEFQKQAELKNLLVMYRSRDYQQKTQYGDRSMGFPNYESVGAYESPALMRYRREITFTDECCDKPCSFPQIVQYCPEEEGI